MSPFRPAAAACFTVLFTSLCLPSVVRSQTVPRGTAAENLLQIRIIPRTIHTFPDIAPLTCQAVQPLDYRQVISLQSLPLKERKQVFINLLLPGILIACHQQQLLRKQVQMFAPSQALAADSTPWLDSLLLRYRARDIEDLMQRLVCPPVSIILAQASLETGWGTSRFFVQAGNIFGIWSFDPGEPRMATRGIRQGKAVYVRCYTGISQAIADYLLTLARGGPYADFRQALMHTRDPLELVKHLASYSELGAEYVRRLTLQMRANQLIRWDSCRLDATYLYPVIAESASPTGTEKN